MAALDRALSLAEVNDGAVMIAEHLEFDVARPLEILLDVDVADTERRFCFALRRLERFAELVGGADHAHAAAAAAGHRFDDHRVAEILRDLLRLLLALDGTLAAGKNRNARLLHRAARARLVAEQPNHIRRRPDEADMARLAHFSEVGALGQEAVARMDGVGAGDFGGAQHRGDAEIAVGAARGADAHVLVGKADVQGVLVGLRVHRDRLDPQLAAGADDAQGDFAAIRDQDFLEHLGRLYREQSLAILDRLAVFHVDTHDFTVVLGRDFVHELHGLDDAQDFILLHVLTDFHE